MVKVNYLTLEMVKVNYLTLEMVKVNYLTLEMVKVNYLTLEMVKVNYVTLEIKIVLPHRDLDILPPSSTLFPPLYQSTVPSVYPLSCRVTHKLPLF